MLGVFLIFLSIFCFCAYGVSINGVNSEATSFNTTESVKIYIQFFLTSWNNWNSNRPCHRSNRRENETERLLYIRFPETSSSNCKNPLAIVKLNEERDSNARGYTLRFVKSSTTVNETMEYSLIRIPWLEYEFENEEISTSLEIRDKLFHFYSKSEEKSQSFVEINCDFDHVNLEWSDGFEFCLKKFEITTPQSSNATHKIEQDRVYSCKFTNESAVVLHAELNPEKCEFDHANFANYPRLQFFVANSSDDMNLFRRQWFFEIDPENRTHLQTFSSYVDHGQGAYFASMYLEGSIPKYGKIFKKISSDYYNKTNLTYQIKNLCSRIQLDGTDLWSKGSSHIANGAPMTVEVRINPSFHSCVEKFSFDCVENYNMTREEEEMECDDPSFWKAFARLFSNNSSNLTSS
uniref:Uncharacterized protein n=1 Tax=Acrobeloides nanus TaxID=290746 RepID=A0A914DV84_9BILA